MTTPAVGVGGCGRGTESAERADPILSRPAVDATTMATVRPRALRTTGLLCVGAVA